MSIAGAKLRRKNRTVTPRWGNNLGKHDTVDFADKGLKAVTRSVETAGTEVSRFMANVLLTC